MAKIHFIINGGGRQAPSPRLIECFHDELRTAGADYELTLSQTIDQSRQLVDEAVATGAEQLWIGGGDGTVHLLMNMIFGKGLTAGIVPLGTVNALARALKIPTDPVKAVRKLLVARPIRLDAGIVNDSIRFFCFASIGFDATVVHAIPSSTKRILGRLSYVGGGISGALKLGSLPRFVAAIKPHGGGDEHTDTGHSLVLSNIQNYAGFQMFRRVAPGSGSMEVYVFREPSITSLLGWCAQRAMGLMHRGGPQKVGHYLFDGLEVKSDSPLALQLDGEAIRLGDGTSYSFKVLPGACTVLA